MALEKEPAGGTFRVSLCNPGGEGSEYHCSSAEASPKIKSVETLALGGIRAERLMDEGRGSGVDCSCLARCAGGSSSFSLARSRVSSATGAVATGGT